MLPDLHLLLDHDQRLSFYRGTDRSIRLQIQDVEQQAPLDLTGLKLTFAFPKSGGSSVKVRSFGLDLSQTPVTVLDGDTYFTVLGHGLVDGQLVTLAPISASNPLPLPFASDTPYQVVVRSSSQFCVRGLSSQRLAVGSPSVVAAQLITSGLDIINAPLGDARIMLTAKQTQAAALGQGQSYQLTILDQDDWVTCLVGELDLDVTEQPCP